MMLDEQTHRLFLQGIEEFNGSNYFVSHELWEELWIGETGPSRRFYQGLIQAAMALHHLSLGNRYGAQKLLARARESLEAYRPKHFGLDMDRFLDQLSGCIDDIPESDLLERKINPVLIPRLQLDSSRGMDR